MQERNALYADIRGDQNPADTRSKQVVQDSRFLPDPADIAEGLRVLQQAATEPPGSPRDRVPDGRMEVHDADSGLSAHGNGSTFAHES